MLVLVIILPILDSREMVGICKANLLISAHYYLKFHSDLKDEIKMIIIIIIIIII